MEEYSMTEFVTMKGKTGTYQVSKDSCTCGDYLYRKKDIGGKCKHMEMLEE
tara:strand:- start:39 stop:191 length:153 start_codon:yes stop_codon:yes gene_type:complete